MQFDNFKIKRLLTLIDFLEKSKESTITMKAVEQASHYSYRNMNRIFKLFFGKSIGKYHKEKVLEASAGQIQFSDKSITDISFDLGYNDLQAFNKAFKNMFGQSPAQFREEHKNKLDQMWHHKWKNHQSIIEKMTFQKKSLPPFKAICLTHYGSYASDSIQDNWDELVSYATTQDLISEESSFFGEILDDNDITKDENCRYISGITIPDHSKFEPEGFFQIKDFSGGNYVVFQHQGDRAQIEYFYEMIFVHWLSIGDFEIADQPLIEFYLNDESDTPPHDLLTDIYIPIE